MEAKGDAALPFLHGGIRYRHTHAEEAVSKYEFCLAPKSPKLVLSQLGEESKAGSSQQQSRALDSSFDEALVECHRV